MAETIMMIHGMWGGPWHWENYKSIFEAEGYNCVTPTLRFHDVSPHSDPDPRLGTTSLLDYADDLEKDIRSLQSRGLSTPPIVIGHSMGGLLAQILASRGLPKAAVLLTPAACAPNTMVLEWSVTKSFWSAMMNWGAVDSTGKIHWGMRSAFPFRSHFGSRPYLPTFDEAVYSMMDLLTPQEQRDAYDKFVYESGRAAWEIGFWFLDLFRRKAAWIDASKVNCPVLVVSGSLDRITPASSVEKVAAKFKSVPTPDAPRHYKEFPGHTHWVLAEPGWQEIAEYVLKWLKAVLK
ncbi:MAG: alpha/beta hydrolase [Desulfomonilaceae bacterium]